ncbi:MAG: hypothetical protein EAZ37_13715 [Burkholderiales bacterium]|nr:MAG: hypothetical protein EAZ37_13715 [Burkholderiales bacterium]
MNSLIRQLFFFFLLGLSLAARAQTCAAPGKEGPCTLNGVINSYHAGANGTVAAGATVIPLVNINGQRTSNRTLQVGDQVLVMQMQDSSNAANAGLHEYASIISIAGNNITLNRPLTNSYVQAVSTTPSVRTFQVVYIPQCSSATVPAANTVSADRWTIDAANGQGTGGIVALDVAGSLAINGTITVAGAGFRGGAGMNGSSSRAGGTFTDASYAFDPAAAHGGLKGEGIVGTPRLVFDGTATPLGYFALIAQGYAAGAAGRGAQGNAAGGGNDGIPPSGSNQYNSGGGGGGNAGAGGQGGAAWNGGTAGPDAGGRGGLAIANTATRLVMGGGGGAGTSNNNGNANSITSWPPIVSTTTRPLPTATGVTNGADGPISSSGASGGGLVLIRAGVLTASSGNVIADGYTAHNNTGGSESAGGGGAGGSVYINALSGSGSGLTISARGGGGGYANWYDHGGGGGGGGGYIQTSLSGASTSINAGTLGYDGCCGGTQGRGSPKTYLAADGSNGIVDTLSAPAGNASGAQCLPQLDVVKTTSTPTVTLPTQTTAQYTVRITNSATAGIAYGVSVVDGLPSPFGLQAITSAASVTYSGTLTGGPTPTTTNQSGSTSTATFGVSGGTNANAFTIGAGGVLTLSFVVNVNTTTVPQTFQNSASTTFTDPTRNTGGTAAAGGNPVVSPGGTYNSGGTVGGSNYASGSSTAEDVRLVGSVNLAITKTNGTTTLVAGQTTSYTVTVSNVSPSVALINGVIADTPTAGLNCTSVTCTNNGTSAVCPVPYNPGPAAFSTLSTGLTIPVLPSNSSLSFVVTCGVTATGQ